MKRHKKKWIETDRKIVYYKYDGGIYCGDTSFFALCYGSMQSNGSKIEMRYKSISKEEAWKIQANETEKRIAESAHNNIFSYTYVKGPAYYRYGHCSCNVCKNDRTFICQCLRCNERRNKK